MSLIHLPKGTTGFWHRSDSPPELRVSLEQFTQAVTRLGAGSRARATDIVSRLMMGSGNFYSALLEHTTDPAKTRVALLNPYVPYAACALPAREAGQAEHELVDPPPDWPSHLCGAEVLSKEVLTSALSKAALSQLAKAELEQVHYWQPQNAGELLFHFWD